ncbi:MAG: ferrous iron transport protein B [Candidatus Baldrarchaeia archaeon]
MSELSKAKHNRIKIALAGTPNVGKSVIFNNLTGGRAWVGNWPGTTVEKKVGKMRIDRQDAEVIDLPGIYSLTAYSLDELIARNAIIEEKPDVVVNILNASNIERSLYLTISLLEMGANVVVALNMIDIARERGYEIDVRKLRELLGVPVVPTIAIKGVGIDELKEEIKKACRGRKTPELIINYGDEVEREIEKIISVLEKDPALIKKYNKRWLAIKLLEKDEDVIERVRKSQVASMILKQVEKSIKTLEEALGRDIEEYIAEKRYEYAFRISNECVKVVREVPQTPSDIIDFAITHKVFGIPIILSILYMAFKFAFDVATPLVDLIDWFFAAFLYDIVKSSTLPEVVKSFLADGVITGIGSILVFLPNIVFLFIFISLLEDLGYMARAAFIIDKIMHRLGLTGKSIIPLIIGIGCNVPAIIATRAIEDENDRNVTALVNPLVSCSARLPVYLVIAAAFFVAYRGVVVLSMYLLGMLLAIMMALLLRKCVFRGPSTGFIMELPPYMTPLPKNVLIKTWERTKRFLFKAGTVILLATVLVWALSVTGPSGYIGTEALEDPTLLEKSWVGVIGKTMQPLFYPMGWDWRAIAALFFGFMAKEIVVSTMAVLYGAAGEEELPKMLSMAFTPLSAYAYMAFVLIYVPCLATLAALRGELGLKYAILALIYEILLAYLVALAIICIGIPLGLK